MKAYVRNYSYFSHRPMMHFLINGGPKLRPTKYSTWMTSRYQIAVMFCHASGRFVPRLTEGDIYIASSDIMLRFEK